MSRKVYLKNAVSEFKAATCPIASGMQKSFTRSRNFLSAHKKPWYVQENGTNNF